MDNTSYETSPPEPPREPVHDAPERVHYPTVHEDPSRAPVVVAQHHSHAGIVVVALVAALLVGAFAGAAGGVLASRFLPRGVVATGDTRQIELVGDTTEEVVSAAAAVAMPSVVNIAVSGGSGSGSEELPEEHPDVPLQGEGSGVAFKEAPDGGTYIITNNHVIDGATAITVTDWEGESYPAELVGGDSESDIAVVLVQADLREVKLGDSDEVEVGQLAIAIGSPFGLQHSVTSGVVSALHRPLTSFSGSNGEYPYVDSIQTDAAINPGNSGGALVNRRGELIGIPSVIYTDTGVSDGVGLAIPVSRAIAAANQLIEKGSVDTPFLGILGQTVTPAFAAQEELPVEQGAFVVEVTEGTEAEKAGVQAGDVIVGVDDERIRSMDELILAVRRRAVGDEVTLTLYRDGEEMTLEMLVGVKPSSNKG